MKRGPARIEIASATIPARITRTIGLGKLQVEPGERRGERRRSLGERLFESAWRPRSSPTTREPLTSTQSPGRTISFASEAAVSASGAHSRTGTSPASSR